MALKLVAYTMDNNRLEKELMPLGTARVLSSEHEKAAVLLAYFIAIVG